MIHGIESILHRVTKVVVHKSKTLPARVFCLSALFKFFRPQISIASSLNGGGPPSHRRARDHDWHGMPSQIKTTWCRKMNFQRALMTTGSKMLHPLLYSMSQAAQRKPFLLIAWDICAEPLKISTNQTFKSSSSFGRKKLWAKTCSCLGAWIALTCTRFGNFWNSCPTLACAS